MTSAATAAATPANNPWMDSPRRYGLVSRVLHWGMALLLGWQFTGMLMKNLLDLNPRESFMVGTHNSVGILLLALILVRGLWALLNLRNRPKQEPGLKGRLAMLGHLAIYLLMVYVPAVAFLRLVGSGREFAWFGVVPMFEAGERVQWMMAPASASHGLMGWVLLTLIIGHLAMVVVHHFVWKDDTLQRMAGKTLK